MNEPLYKPGTVVYHTDKQRGKVISAVVELVFSYCDNSVWEHNYYLSNLSETFTEKQLTTNWTLAAMIVSR